MKKGSITVSGKTFIVEIADTDAQREKGLSGHAPLRDTEGMLFVFDRPDRYGFWMPDMKYPIDIVWISATSTVVHMEKSVSPDTYPKIFYPTVPALYVLEISAGQLDVLGTNIGDQVKIIKK